MPVRWSTLKVIETADIIEQYVNEATPPLIHARAAAQAALSIPNLPQYVDQHFRGLMGEIDRAIGGSQWGPVGCLNARILSIRDSVPEKALEAEKRLQKESDKHCRPTLFLSGKGTALRQRPQGVPLKMGTRGSLALFGPH